MPTYDYRCEHCGHELAVFHSISAKPLRKCPECDKEQLRRLIGAGAGIIFKGSGFYETDYKRARTSSPSRAKEEKTGKTERTGKTSETKSDAPKKSDD